MKNAKLTLKGETIRLLNALDLTRAAGGYPMDGEPATRGNTDCYSEAGGCHSMPCTIYTRACLPGTTVVGGG
jgi:hypothetical protein